MSATEPIYVFDKDGVLVESEPIKLVRFEELFEEEYAEYVPPIRALNRSEIGMARKEKLVLVFRDIIGLNDEALSKTVDAYLERSYHFVKEALLKAPALPGVIEFIHQSPNTKYVCSNALHAEVMDQLVTLQINDAFQKIFAFPDKKADVLANLKLEHAPHPIVFWGDTKFDYEAAVSAEVAFIGLDKDSHNDFKGLNVHTIKDFTDQAGIRDWIVANAKL